MKRTEHVCSSLCVVFFRGAKPIPTFVLTFDVYFFPKLLHLPVGVKVKVLHINCTSPFLYFLHAVKALSHQTEAPLMPWMITFVPQTLDVFVFFYFLLEFSD